MFNTIHWSKLRNWLYLTCLTILRCSNYLFRLMIECIILTLVTILYFKKNSFILKSASFAICLYACIDCIWYGSMVFVLTSNVQKNCSALILRFSTYTCNIFTRRKKKIYIYIEFTFNLVNPWIFWPTVSGSLLLFMVIVPFLLLSRRKG